MGLKKKLGVLLLILGLVFLFSGINPETSLMTGHIFKEYIQGENILVHSFGLIFLILGLFLLVERKGLDYLIIPTGDDLKKMKRAKEAAQEKADHYLISGYDRLEGRKIYKELRKAGIKPSEMVLEKKSKDTLENVIYSFKKMHNPKNVGITSYPKHLDRFKMIIEKAQEEGKISKKINVEYIPTKQSLKETVYGILANMKEKHRLKKGIDSAMKNPTKGVLSRLRKVLGNIKKED